MNSKVSLKKPGSLGLSMKYSAVSAGIIIDSVLPEGLIAEWNQSHTEQIAPGDRIIALDGVTLAGKRMLEEMKMRLGEKPGQCELLRHSVFSRPLTGALDMLGMFIAQ